MAAYEDYEPAYRYGSDLGANGAIAAAIGQRSNPMRVVIWESRNPNDGWERFKAAVRRGWERTSDAVERAIPGDSDRDGR